MYSICLASLRGHLQISDALGALYIDLLPVEWPLKHSVCVRKRDQSQCLVTFFERVIFKQFIITFGFQGIRISLTQGGCLVTRNTGLALPEVRHLYSKSRHVLMCTWPWRRFQVPVPHLPMRWVTKLVS